MADVNNYPIDAICAEDVCGHQKGAHVNVGPSGKETCLDCLPAAQSIHAFKLAKLAGGAISAADEQAAYQRALRGE